MAMDSMIYLKHTESRVYIPLPNYTDAFMNCICASGVLSSPLGSSVVFVPNALDAMQFYHKSCSCRKLRQRQSEPKAHGGAAENRKAIPNARARTVSEASLRLVLFANCRLSTHK